MPPEPETPGSAADWLRFAQADLAFAQAPLPERALYSQLCFFAQQAVEKSLKAVLVKGVVDFPFTHDLQALVNLIPQEIPRDPVLDAATRLGVYAVATRYPGRPEPVSEDEYREAARLADAVFRWAATRLGRDPITLEEQKPTTDAE